MASHAPAPGPAPASAPANMWGIFGLILSILAAGCGVTGFCTYGVTSAIGLVLGVLGLIFSFIGMRHPAKGIAIGGVVVGIIGTIISLIGTLILGAFGLCCGGMFYLAAEQAAMKNAVEPIVAERMEMDRSQIRIEEFKTGSPFESGARQVSGTAVYTDDEGKELGVDFMADMEKIDGKWQGSNVQITGEPYEWIDPDLEEHEFD